MPSKRNPPGRPAASRGFTLMELMVAVALIGVGASLAVPDLARSVRRERALAETAKIAAALERARNRSRIEACRTVITVNAATGSLLLAADPVDPDTSCRTRPGRTFTFDRDLVTLGGFSVGGAARTALVIEGTGGFGGTARARLPVTLKTGGSRTVEVWPAIGTVRVTS